MLAVTQKIDLERYTCLLIRESITQIKKVNILLVPFVNYLGLSEVSLCVFTVSRCQESHFCILTAFVVDVLAGAPGVSVNAVILP